MRKVAGYQAEDGKFFESAADAEYYEARSILEGLLVAYMERPELFINILEKNHVEVTRFIKAINVKSAIASERAIAEAEEDQVDDGVGEKNDVRTLQLQTVGGQHVPDLGRSVSAKEIREQRTQYGTRSRKRNARSLRRSTDLAVKRDTTPAKARSSDGGKTVQEGSLEGVSKERHGD